MPEQPIRLQRLITSVKQCRSHSIYPNAFVVISRKESFYLGVDSITTVVLFVQAPSIVFLVPDPFVRRPSRS